MNYLTHSEAAQAKAKGKEIETLWPASGWLPFEWRDLNQPTFQFRYAPTPPDSVNTGSPEPAPLLTALDITTIPIDEQHELRKVDDLWQLFSVCENSWVRSLNGYESEFVTCAIRSAALQTAARVLCIDTATHVSVPKMTAAEAREKCRAAFVTVFGHYPEWSGTAAKLLWNTRWDAHETGYLAALRDAGAIL